MRKIRVLVVLAGAVLAGLSAPAVTVAVLYSGSGIGVSNNTPVQGGACTVTAKGFAPNSSVEILFLPTPISLGTFTADASGVVSAAVQIPAGTSGQHVIRVIGVAPDQTPLVLDVPITVSTVASEAPGQSSSNLPTTGADSSKIWASATVVIGVGAALVALVVLRRRRAATSG